MAEELSSRVGRRSAYDALIRAMRAQTHESDSLRLIDTATVALADCSEDLRAAGPSGLVRVFSLDELAQPHLRRMASELIGPARAIATRAHDTWIAGEQFLSRLMQTYAIAQRLFSPARLQRLQQAELLVRQMRCAGTLIHWRAYAYFPGGVDLWSDILVIHRAARESGLAARPFPLKRGRGGHSSTEREFARAFALGCASLDQLSPDSIDIAERLIRYIAPTLVVSDSRGSGAAYTVSPAGQMVPRRVLGAGDAAAEEGRLFLQPSGAAAVLDELASVIAKGLVPNALASGLNARERVLLVIHHLQRLWSSAPSIRRHRRHALAGKLQAVNGFHYIRGELAAGTIERDALQLWDMLDVSLNGIGITVPADDCDRLSVGDLVGVRGEDGPNWHVGVVRRIIRADDGTGIVGMESIARSAVTAKIDDGRNPADVLVLDPVRRGNAIRLAQALPHAFGKDAVFLNQDGRIMKLRLLSRLYRGEDFEVLSYRVL